MNEKDPNKSIRPSVLVAAIALIGLGIGTAMWVRSRRPQDLAPVADSPSPTTETSGSAPRQTRDQEENLPQLVERPSEKAPALGQTSTAAQRPKPATPLIPATPRVEPSPQTRQLVESLIRLESSGAPQAEQSAQWKDRLKQLVQQGAAGVPAILEFLDKNMDVGFGREGSQMLGYPSARVAMFDALLQIGGPEAISAMSQTLQATADPREIALLARNLEQLEPEQHRQEALEAARQTLAMVAAGKSEGTDVAPLFEVLKRFGGAAAASDLEQAGGSWNYYAAIALAQLPDGAGIPSLIRIVQNPEGKAKSLPALEMLAEVSSQYPEAREALLQQTRANEIPASRWPYLASVLAGERYQYQDSLFETPATPINPSDIRTFHISVGNQNFSAVAGAANFSPDQMQQQMGLIDELLSATSNPAAVQALQQARANLAKHNAQSPTATR